MPTEGRHREAARSVLDGRVSEGQPVAWAERRRLLTFELETSITHSLRMSGFERGMSDIAGLRAEIRFTERRSSARHLLQRLLPLASPDAHDAKDRHAA